MRIATKLNSRTRVEKVCEFLYQTKLKPEAFSVHGVEIPVSKSDLKQAFRQIQLAGRAFCGRPKSAKAGWKHSQKRF